MALMVHTSPNGAYTLCPKQPFHSSLLLTHFVGPPLQLWLQETTRTLKYFNNTSWIFLK